MADLITKNSRIIGIDPGSRITGYAVLVSLRDAPRSMHDFNSLEYGTFRASPQLSFIHRVGFMHQKVHQLMQRIQPRHCVIEDAYVRDFPRSALKLAQVRGALIAAALSLDVAVYEMTASHAKKNITGGGAADKKQVAHMLLQSFLRSAHPKDSKHQASPPPLKGDASDALALALAWGMESTLNAQKQNCTLRRNNR